LRHRISPQTPYWLFTWFCQCSNTSAPCSDSCPADGTTRRV